MKKLFTLSFLVVLLFAYNANAQSPRMVLAEEFTQASCPPCATQNPAFNALLEANTNKVCAIKYQTNWPGSDPMNANTQSMVGPRVTYYGVSGVPHARMDGVAHTGNSYTGAPANWTQAKLNTRAAIMSPFTLTLSHTVDYVNDSMHITGNIECTQAVSGTLVLHVAVVEHVIEFCTAPGTNGEKDFEGVMQLMLPSSSGTSLPGTWTVGQQQAFSFDIKLPGYIYDKKELSAVAFIQDNASPTKEVHQAAISVHVPLAVDAMLPCGAIGNIPVLTCTGGVTPDVTIENVGSTPITALSITYDIDGNNPATTPWAGNLAPNSTAVVSLPNLNPAAGSHTLNVSISDPNGSADLNPFQEFLSAKFNISSTTGIAPPLVQPFTSSIFPPAGWIINNIDNGVTWTRNSSAGFNGNGCAKINFWSSPNGQVDELFVPNYDFSDPGITFVNIDFDVAYKQYSASSNDRIQIYYSTDCGQNWTSAFNESGTTLASGNPVATSAWTPDSAHEWHHKTASLNGVIGNNNVFVKFTATSGFGNNAYLDNINISTNMTVSVPELLTDNQVIVYPNPSNGNFNVQMNFENGQDVIITVTNALGAIIKTMNVDNVTSDVIPVDLSFAAKGTYEVTVKSSSSVVSKRIAITE